MKATITKQEHSGKIAYNRKENAFSRQLSIIADDPNGGMKEIIACRIYATNARHYCAVWIHSHPVHLSGGGHAGGYGYHRASDAVQQALNDAGVVLDQAFGGHGDGAIREALEATAAALGYKRILFHEAHA